MDTKQALAELQAALSSPDRDEPPAAAIVALVGAFVTSQERIAAALERLANKAEGKLPLR